MIKRFTYEEINFCNDNITGNQYDLTNPNEMLELLNELHEENKQLKSINQDHKDHLADFYADYDRLEKENEQLKLSNRLLLEEMKEIRDKLTVYLEIKKGDLE